MTKKILKVDNLQKYFGQKQALKSVSFEVAGGDLFGILGKNGAGKTVLLNCLKGILEPDDGRITFEGNDISRDINSYQCQINFAAAGQFLQQQATVEENLLTYAGLYGVKEAKKEVKKTLELMQMSANEWRGRKLYGLSSGEMAKINLAKALISRPKLLLLDEITAFLDPVFKREIWQILQQANKQGMTIIYTSHQLDEIRQLCNRIIVLKEGKVAYFGSVINDEKKLLSFY